MFYSDAPQKRTMVMTTFETRSPNPSPKPNPSPNPTVMLALALAYTAPKGINRESKRWVKHRSTGEKTKKEQMSDGKK